MAIEFGAINGKHYFYFKRYLILRYLISLLLPKIFILPCTFKKNSKKIELTQCLMLIDCCAIRSYLFTSGRRPSNRIRKLLLIVSRHALILTVVKIGLKARTKRDMELINQLVH